MSQSSSVLQHVGTNIRSLRDERGLSQQDLADRAGVSRRTIAALETSKVNISLAKLDAIAAVLGVDFRTIVSAPELKEHGIVNALAWQGEKEESKATFLASVPSVLKLNFGHGLWLLGSLMLLKLMPKDGKN